ncbi:hypothetical protein PG997_014948 [Apiospora hydei]|uniref:Uncharacterized protein n=1 Tax=Apiospora hydei TaxID=1337664 RepID=A0ABR1UV91_9PEZI
MVGEEESRLEGERGSVEDHGKLCLILESGLGGELFAHLNAEEMFPKPVAAFDAVEMALALSHLHMSWGSCTAGGLMLGGSCFWTGFGAS